jgi:hypothetical protein
MLAALLAALLLIWLVIRPPVKEAAPGNDRFGLCFVSAPDHLADEARYQGALLAGARWDRWPLYWHWVDQGGYVGYHTGGRHDYDTLVAQEITHGLTPVAILLGTPARLAQTNPASPALPGLPADKPASLPLTITTATLPPANLDEPIFSDGSDTPSSGKTINPANAWASFVYATVERYRPQGSLARQQGWPAEAGVRYWEIWNEPDYRLFWNGTVEEYYRLLEVAYHSIKAADPGATVLLGGLAFYERRDWFPSLLRQAGGDPARAYFDVFSFHHYLSIYQSEEYIRQARTTLDSFGLSQVPIWVTESGVAVWDDYPATAHGVPAKAPFRATLTEQAAYLIQNSALAFYQGVARYYHFMLHDDCGDGPGSAYGLRQNFSPHVCHPAAGLPRPAYAAYQLAAAHFQDLIPLWRVKRYEQDQVAFYRPTDRSRVVVVWATQGLSVTTTITATGPTGQLYWVEPTATLSGTTGLNRSLTLTPTNGVYSLSLAPATNQNGLTDKLSYQIGGPPFILVETDTRPPDSQVKALPPASSANFWVAWQGDDPGSGMAGYEVWMSQDGQPLQLWLSDTLRTEAPYAGQVNHSYGFAVRARDRAGNQQPLPVQPQVTTHIVAGPALGGMVLGPGGEPVANATVSITGGNLQESLTTDTSGQWPPVSLPPGDYTLQASAAGYSAWPNPRQVSLAADPQAITLTLTPVVNAVTSGDFEGQEVWNRWDWAGQVNLSIDAFDGQAAARLGEGRGETMTCPDQRPGQRWLLRQQVAIPAESTPVLSFLHRLTSPPAATSDNRFEVVVVGQGQSQSLPVITPEPAAEWQLAWFDMSRWRGQTVELQFVVVNCARPPFVVGLDRVSVGSR